MKHLIAAVFIGLLFTNHVMAKEADWSDYAKALELVRSGKKNGTFLAVVDYAALKQNGQIEKAYQKISQFDVNQLQGHDEKLAFYINAYNILALKMVLDHWPQKSIKDIGSFFSPVWKKEAGIIAGKMVSLDYVENKIIRPMGEPRIHVAIVCASVSCPDLRNEPYTAAKLNQQLNDQAKIFLANNKKGMVIQQGELKVSKIFKWFKQDFDRAGGVEGFIRDYRTDLAGSTKVDDYLDYDWAVNALEK